MLEASEGALDTVRRVFDVNFFGAVAGTLAVLPWHGPTSIGHRGQRVL